MATALRLESHIRKLIDGCDKACARLDGDETMLDMYWRADGAGDVLEQLLLDLPSLIAAPATPDTASMGASEGRHE